MKQPFFLLTLLLISLNNFAIPGSCEGRSIEGRDSSVLIDQQNSHIIINLRCFGTGDIWLDCDTDSGKFEQNEGILTMGSWSLELGPRQSAQLYFKDRLWADLDCIK